MPAQTFATVATSLGDEALALASLTGHEALGRPFIYELELFSHDPDIGFDSVIAKPATIQLELTTDSHRFIHGIVTKFARVGGHGRHSVYTATLRPWLWTLAHTQDSRIFQNITVPNLVKELLRPYGPIEEQLSRPYRQWEYLVQYRESTFDFVSRLLEQEGIYYYFKHEQDKHTLCLCDSYGGHSKNPGYERIPYYPPYPGERRDRDHIDGWRMTQEIQTGSFVLHDFDFKKPKAGLTASLRAEGNATEHERFDFPGEYEELKDGEQYLRDWMEQVTSQYEVLEGQGNARGITLGSLFELTEFPRKDQNREYLVTALTCSLSVGDYESAEAEGARPEYRCSFSALESHRPFRPARTTRKPEITGPQTAIVVGGAPQGKPEPDEIHTDQYGRVRLRFHWQRPHTDSNGQADDPNSCWVRVAQIWAGSGWGGIHIPRIGQEVIVEFLEGDPDRPIVTGCVYNRDNMPPYELPTNKTQSGIKSRSSKGGTQNNFNELRFEDKKNKEQVYLQAEKDLDTLVKNNETHTVQANRTKSISGNENNSIGGDRTKAVTGNETNTIDKTRKTTVTLAETQNYLATRTTTVEAVDTLTVNTGARLETYTSGRTTSIKKFDNLTVHGANKNTTVHGQFNITSDEHFKLQQKASQVYVKDQVFIETDGDIQLKNGGTHYTGGQSGKLSLNVDSEITITCGAASIALKKDGTIDIVGVKVKIGNASNNASFEPAGASISAAKINSTAVGIHEIVGALVKIG